MKVEVQLKNTELWVTDFNDDPHKRAKILSLNFLGDMSYKADSLQREFTFTKNL